MSIIAGLKVVYGSAAARAPEKRFVYDLKPGERWAHLDDGRLLVVHRCRGSKLVHHDGSETVIHDMVETRN